MIGPGQMKVLIVEDNPGDAFLVEEYLRNSEIRIDEIYHAQGWREALIILDKVNIAIILLDLNLSDTSGLETFGKFEKIAPEIPIVVLSGHQDKLVAIETMKNGAQDYLVKGTFNATLLGKAVNYAIERSCYIKNLWEKEEEYKYLFDNNPNPLLTFDKSNLRFTMVNSAALEFYGLSAPDFLRKKLTDIFDASELFQNNDSLIREILSENNLHSRKQLKAGNQPCYVDLVLKDVIVNGINSRIMLVNDVTEKFLAMEKVVQSRQQLHKLAGNYPNGTIAIIGKDFNIQYIDGLELKKKGIKSETVIGKNYTYLMNEKNREIFKTNIEKVFRGEDAVFYIEVKDESFLISATEFVNNEDKVENVIIVSQNITGNILAEMEIFFQANILKNVTDAIVVKDLTGKVVYWNQSATKLFGFPPENAVGKLLIDTIKSDEFLENFDVLKQQIAKKGEYKLEFNTIRADGRNIVVETTQSFIYDDKERPAYVIGISHDITDRIEAELVVKESEANLQAIFQSTSQSFLLMDTTTKILVFNKNASDSIWRFFQHKIRVGDIFRSLIWDDKMSDFNAHMNDVLNRKIVRFEEKYNFPELKEVWLEVSYSPVLKDDKVIGIIMCVEDTTARYRSEEAILKSEQKYRELVETSIDMIWTIDTNGNVIFVNSAAREILGWEPNEIIGRNFIEFLDPSEKEKVFSDVINALMTSDQYSNYESKIRRKDGSEAYVITHGVVNHDEKSGKSWLTGTTRDITDRVLAEKELSQKNEQLRLLSSYLQTIREEERTYIAREIHDELGQQLTGLKMDLAFMNRKFGNKDMEFSNKLSEMMKLVDETIRFVRKISSDLRPGILDDLGLVPAIEWQCLEFTKRTKIKCEFVNKVQDTMIDSEVATGVFRILQESLTNIARHSEATMVNVEIKKDEENFSLTIRDNGKGFVQDTILVKKTLGLVGMQERAAMLNGALSISSLPLKGTLLKLVFPVNKTVTEKV